jgi:DNA mismatch endonuclease (patch repair protein)
MADIFTRTKRSAVMSRIRGTGNRDTEMRLIEILRANKLSGWRRGARLFGKPDFVFAKQRVAIFVDGCFWHRHVGCRFSYTPKSRLDFWLRKFSQNVARDRLVTRTLRNTGWRVLRIWECEIVPRRQHRVINRVRRTLEFVPSEGKKTSIVQKISR